MDADRTIVRADDVDDFYAGTDVPGEFRSLTQALQSEQFAVTLIRVPPHCDFEQGTGHTHDEIEAVEAGSVVRVPPQTRRSHRNEGDEPVEMWAVSLRNDTDRGNKIDEFWDASPAARQLR